MNMRLVEVTDTDCMISNEWRAGARSVLRPRGHAPAPFRRQVQLHLQPGLATQAEWVLHPGVRPQMERGHLLHQARVPHPGARREGRQLCP